MHKVISDAKRADLENRFMYHAPQGDQDVRYAFVREHCLALAMSLHEVCPESLELSVALTALDTVMFSANAAIARNPADSGPRAK